MTTSSVQMTPGQRCLLELTQRKLLDTMQCYVNVNNDQVRNMHPEELQKLRDKIKRIALNQKQFSSEILSGRGNNTIPKETFLQALGLVTKEEFTKLTSKSNERRRRKTANPRFSHEAIQAKKALEPLQRRQLESRNSRGGAGNGGNTGANATKKPNGRNQAKAKAVEPVPGIKANISQQTTKSQSDGGETTNKSSGAKKANSNNNNNNNSNNSNANNQQAQGKGDNDLRSPASPTKRSPGAMSFLDALYMRCREYRVQQIFKSDEIRKKRQNNERLKEELLMLQGRELGLMEAIEAIKGEKDLLSVSQAIRFATNTNNNNDLTATNNNIDLITASKRNAHFEDVNKSRLGLGSAANSNNIGNINGSNCINSPRSSSPPQEQEQQQQQLILHHQSSISEPVDLYNAMRCEESLDGLND